MKKRVLSTVLLALSLGLASCGNNYTQKFADKVNSAAATEDAKDDVTLEKCEKALGKEYTSALFNGTGVCVWTKVKGNTTYTMTITFANKVATAAAYGESTQEDK